VDRLAVDPSRAEAYPTRRVLTAGHATCTAHAGGFPHRGFGTGSLVARPGGRPPTPSAEPIPFGNYGSGSDAGSSSWCAPVGSLPCRPGPRVRLVAGASSRSYGRLVIECRTPKRWSGRRRIALGEDAGAWLHHSGLMSIGRGRSRVSFGRAHLPMPRRSPDEGSTKSCVAMLVRSTAAAACAEPWNIAYILGG
jgi:hypothetical protein